MFGFSFRLQSVGIVNNSDRSPSSDASSTTVALRREPKSSTLTLEVPKLGTYLFESARRV